MYQQYQDSFSHTAYLGPYREKISWRYLPPQIQEYRPDPVRSYLDHLDQLLKPAEPYHSRENKSYDIVDAVLANQSSQHQVRSHHLVSLILERKQMAQQHERDIDHRLGELLEARSITRMLNPTDGGKRMTNIERQILDAEKQKRDVQLRLWKDILELRDSLLTERDEYKAGCRRIDLLSGGRYG